MAKLFGRLQAIFGHKWTSQIDDDAIYRLAIEEWRDQLQGISMVQIADGLRRMRQRTGSDAAWPPTPIEFKKLCKPHREPYERAEFQRRELPQNTASLEVGRVHLAKIWRELKQPGQAK